MTKDEIILLFKEYNPNLTRIHFRQEDIKQLEQDKIRLEPNITAKLDSNGHTNEISDSTGNIAVKNIELEKEIDNKINDINKEISKLNKKIEDVDSLINALEEKDRQVMKDKYIKGLSIYQISEQEYKSESCINKIIKKCFDLLETI